METCWETYCVDIKLWIQAPILHMQNWIFVAPALEYDLYFLILIARYYIAISLKKNKIFTTSLMCSFLGLEQVASVLYHFDFIITDLDTFCHCLLWSLGIKCPKVIDLYTCIWVVISVYLIIDCQSIFAQCTLLAEQVAFLNSIFRSFSLGCVTAN